MWVLVPSAPARSCADYVLVLLTLAVPPRTPCPSAASEVQRWLLLGKTSCVRDYTHTLVSVAIPCVTERGACRSYVIGGERYSLSDIEHAVLRANGRRPSGMSSFLLPRFSQNDARYGSACQTFDNRINFCLSNWTTVGPSVRVFHHKHLDTELQNASKVRLAAGRVVAGG